MSQVVLLPTGVSSGDQLSCRRALRPCSTGFVRLPDGDRTRLPSVLVRGIKVASYPMQAPDRAD